MADTANIDFGTNRNWYWEAGLAEVRFQALVDGQPILCRVSEGWIEATIGAFETNAESLEAVKNASELVCDEFRLRHSQDQLEIDGSLLLKGIGRGD
ncbi:MAG: DUF1488 family protein [Rhodospirillaceae bacterium]|jgi:hypothetical protein|nr:DUF1488 family protein [Rhodospirillaceae bacterium]MBT8002446.1 DUF1488 family protein [Rhodospirillales bacterium]MBT4116464.1 DUF1488 family protein [Rhodospirillaceae bacterium]MBT4673627.1 DUF1488 family protein [Rhodospirillaceae bacterium]MBT4720951.1 DUF1488 family protein [Rhodospirillaceae bacterium]